MPRMPDANDPIAIASLRERRAAAAAPPRPPPTPLEVARLEVAVEVAQLRANFARAAEETHRLRELNNNLVVRNSELHRQSERDVEQIAALHALVQTMREKRRTEKHDDCDDEIPSESEEEEEEEEVVVVGKRHAPSAPASPRSQDLLAPPETVPDTPPRARHRLHPVAIPTVTLRGDPNEDGERVDYEQQAMGEWLERIAAPAPEPTLEAAKADGID